MKFLCEQCKAKYQIADEKVAGKTVRMKCRKCGHMIEVKAEVTETSVASALPRGEDDDKTKVGVDVASLLSSAAKPGAPRPSPAGKPSTLPARQAPRPGGLATSLAAAKPPPRAERNDSALAGAFQRSVQRHEDLAPLETSNEWYVAINGVPVGPVRLGELRRKAAVGAVTDESLVWQEGMEEWRPLKTVPDLVILVREAAASERPSLVTSQPPGAYAPRPSHPSRPPMSTRPDAVRSPSPAPAAAAVAAAAARSNVVSIASRLATAEKLEPAPAPSIAPDPFATPPPPDMQPAAALASPAAGVGSPFASPFPSSPPVLEAAATKKGPNWMAVAMVVLAAAFGITAAIAIFVKPAAPAMPATVVVTQTVPAAPAPPPNGTADTTAATATAPEPSATAGKTVVATGGNHHTTGPAPTASSKVDPSIAALLGGPGTGPSVGPSHAGSSNLSALSADAISNVVRQRTPGVKRTCWERGGGTESNVNVRVHLVIAATGGVRSASADGNDPIVTHCIENQTRSWTFPPSSGTTNVDIPFHFLRQ